MNDDDDVICPITLEVFRDPVRAGDGRVYERDAITRWITAHGTSPFTREPLRLEDLREEPHLKVLASRRRNSTVSYNARHGRVILPPIATGNRHSRNTVHPVEQPFTTIAVRSNRFMSSCRSHWVEILVTLFLVGIPVLVVSITLGVLFSNRYEGKCLGQSIFPLEHQLARSFKDESFAGENLIYNRCLLYPKTDPCIFTV